MLSPKKPKYRKQQKKVRHITGVETRGCKLSFGEFGLRALEPGWITSRQIEASRIAINRQAKRGGKTFIRIFPDKPIADQALNVHMFSINKRLALGADKIYGFPSERV